MPTPVVVQHVQELCSDRTWEILLKDALQKKSGKSEGILGNIIEIHI